MAEYIEREALYKEVTEKYRDITAGSYPYNIVAHDMAQLVKNAPTADVAEVRHGRWYRHDKKKHGDTCYYCSVCEKMALADCLVWELTDYCPNCGAKMDGKGEAE